MLVAVSLLPVFFASCLKDEDKTIVLFGEEGYVKEFREVFGLPADSVMEMDAIGIEPPDVRGEFEFALRECIYPADYENPDDTLYFRFGDGKTGSDYLHGQHHLIVHCDIMIPGLDFNSSMFRTDTAYVRGHGDMLTVYMQRKNEVSTPYLGHTVRYILTQGIAISGRRTGAHRDITDAQLALFNKDVQILNLNELEPEVVEAINSVKGKLFVFKDSDQVTRCNISDRPFVDWDE